MARIVLLVRDFERSLAFYRDALGLRVRGAPRGGWAELEGGGALLCLRGPWEGMAFDPGAFGRSPDEILFLVPDLDAAAARLRGKGIPVEDPHEPGPGLRVAAFRDPDGRRLALEERRAPSDPARPAGG